MSDSFADLWSSTAPSKQQPTLRQTPVSSRPITPASNPLFDSQPRPSHLPNYNRPIQLTSKPIATPSNASGDPFGGLLSGIGSGTGGGNSRMTMAEMAAQAQQKQRSEQVSSKQPQPGTSGALWSGLDSLASRGTPSPAGGHITLNNDNDDWGLDFGSSSKASTTSKPPQKATSNGDNRSDDFDDMLGFGNFGGSSKPTPSTSSVSTPPVNTPGATLWDALDSFKDVSVSQLQPKDDDGFDDLGFGLLPTTTQATAPPARVDSPSEDFDFGNPSRSAPSPPPHILGRLVEMGFMPDRAKVALRSTYNPDAPSADAAWDVEGAVATLIGSGSTTPARGRDSPDTHPPSRRSRPPPAPSTRSQHSSRPTANESGAQASGDILSQASEIGISMFNRANTFWNTKGKEMKDKVVERVVKVYEETAGSREGATSRSGSSQDRPRWMQTSDEHVQDSPVRTSVKYSDGEEEPLRRPTQPHHEPENVPPKHDRATIATVEVDLFSSDAPVAAYVSPFRRGKPKPESQAASSVASTSSLRHATPPPPPKRSSLVACSASTLTQSNKQKAQGTEFFKLGQYAEAHAAYTRAIETLPPGHLCRVTLYNNRALASSRMGDVKGAMLDSSQALQVICGVPENNPGGLGDLDPTSSVEPSPDRSKLSFDPRKESKITSLEEGSEVDLGGMWIKASKRRAEAFEGLEKWAEAKKDWEMILSSGDWVGENVRREAVSGVGRCKRMIDGPTPSSTVSSTAKPRAPTRPPPRPAPVTDKPSAALNALRAVTNQAEAEAEQKHNLKDVVDAKLATWKGGKETNIRALIASLDTLLWPELGWKKVGMGELVTENQVKIRYMKAIAKVHPDKITTSNTTLEQRMIANSVFGALNEAWNAFKKWLNEINPQAYAKYYSEEALQAKMGTLSLEAQTKLEKDTAKKEAKAEAKADAAMKKKLASQVTIKRIERNKRKYITAVHGLEAFEVDLKKAAKQFASKFATGASVTKNAQGLDEVVVQGDVSDEILEMIEEEVGVLKGIPADNVELVEEKKKKGSATDS
ncbi:hypothetical protein ONZ45_g588 [Pleurotus djamor]|nr:hypothetical protein ONZ45_g588 [Pleurotus djamor]